MHKLEDIHGHEVRPYASDLARVGETDESEFAQQKQGRLARAGARCRSQVTQRPWTSLAVASFAGGALGALAGFYMRGRR